MAFIGLIFIKLSFGIGAPRDVCSLVHLLNCGTSRSFSTGSSVSSSDNCDSNNSSTFSSPLAPLRKSTIPNKFPSHLTVFQFTLPPPKAVTITRHLCNLVQLSPFVHQAFLHLLIPYKNHLLTNLLLLISIDPCLEQRNQSS